MDFEKLLIYLKLDLQLITKANDEFLLHLLTVAKNAIEREGITLTQDDPESEGVVIQYAAYLFRKRAGEDTAMPRFLRYMLNNMLISQKGAAE